uniref:Methyltransferase domain-containing protein n=1 Tax=Candidatus Kentrum sp. DK TaxID=2126562 RepID=A0A450SWJ5_9GAMM|nr:MAG: Methyltransferase domain-containing protein [Candidatus Kentron sp. DK]
MDRRNFWKGDFIGFFDVEDELRTTVVHPYISDELEKLKCGKILDYGCGRGDLLRSLELSGSMKYTGYDPSMKCINAARSIHRKIPNVSFTDSLEELSDSSFDVVILSFVLITIDNQYEARDAITNSIRLLMPNGRIIFCETHPCFRDHIFTTLETDMDMTNYNKPFHPINVRLCSRGHSSNDVSFVDYHNSLSDIFELFISGGICISKITEIYDNLGKGKADATIVERYKGSPPAFLYLEGIRK